jgi:hypothetical protein
LKTRVRIAWRCTSCMGLTTRGCRSRLSLSPPPLFICSKWWAKQEPLCLEADNLLSIPERLVIALATYVECASLILGDRMGEGRTIPVMSPRVIQAFLWPVHNVFLCAWICLILATTYLTSLFVMCQTLLFGAKRTNSPLGRLFAEEVHPCARAVESLCEYHQAIGVRVSGLALMPLMIVCDASAGVVGRLGVLAGSLAFVCMGVCGWWYWVSLSFTPLSGDRLTRS